MDDLQIINGVLLNNGQRPHFERALYLNYQYFIEQGKKKYNLSHDESFDAYNDAVLATIISICDKTFKNDASLKTYLFQIYSNKCVDLVRKKTTNKSSVYKSAADPELLYHLPDTAKSAIERLIDQQKIDAIARHLDVLGGKCKEILLLYEDGYTDKEIAEKLTYNSPSVAKTTRLRCIDKIRENMKGLFTTV